MQCSINISCPLFVWTSSVLAHVSSTDIAIWIRKAPDPAYSSPHMQRLLRKRINHDCLHSSMMEFNNITKVSTCRDDRLNLTPSLCSWSNSLPSPCAFPIRRRRVFSCSLVLLSCKHDLGPFGILWWGVKTLLDALRHPLLCILIMIFPKSLHFHVIHGKSSTKIFRKALDSVL